MAVTVVELEKCVVKELITSKSIRISFDKPLKGCSKVWVTFQIVKVDGKVSNYVYCSLCHEILKWKSRDGTSGLQYHISSACISAASTSNTSKITDLPKFALAKSKPCVSAKVKSETADNIVKMCATDIR